MTSDKIHLTKSARDELGDRFDPGIYISEYPKARNIYGEKKIQEDSLEYEIIVYLLRKGNEYGKKAIRIASELNSHYNTINTIAKKSEYLDVFLFSESNQNRIRIVREKAGWSEEEFRERVFKGGGHND